MKIIKNKKTKKAFSNIEKNIEKNSEINNLVKKNIDNIDNIKDIFIEYYKNKNINNELTRDVLILENIKEKIFKNLEYQKIKIKKSEIIKVKPTTYSKTLKETVYISSFNSDIDVPNINNCLIDLNLYNSLVGASSDVNGKVLVAGNELIVIPYLLQDKTEIKGIDISYEDIDDIELLNKCIFDCKLNKIYGAIDYFLESEDLTEYNKIYIRITNDPEKLLTKYKKYLILALENRNIDLWLLNESIYLLQVIIFKYLNALFSGRDAVLSETEEYYYNKVEEVLKNSTIATQDDLIRILNDKNIFLDILK